jgi:hypothetical protein
MQMKLHRVPITVVEWQEKAGERREQRRDYVKLGPARAQGARVAVKRILCIVGGFFRHEGPRLILIQAEEMKAKFDVDSTMFFNKAVNGDAFAATELKTGESHRYFEQFHQKTCPDILRAMERFTVGGFVGMSIFDRK